MTVLVDCPCGCGRTFDSVGSRGRPRSYYSPACSLRVNRISGGGEGRRHTAETRARLRELAQRPKPWLRGERNGMYGRTGRLSPTYKDGSSPERQRLYSGNAWRQLRREVLERDGRSCRVCGSQSSLHLHHVKPWAGYPELRFDLDNVVTLCRPCHYEAHREGVRSSVRRLSSTTGT